MVFNEDKGQAKDKDNDMCGRGIHVFAVSHKLFAQNTTNKSVTT